MKMTDINFDLEQNITQELFIFSDFIKKRKDQTSI